MSVGGSAYGQWRPASSWMLPTSLKKGVKTPVHFKTSSWILIPDSFMDSSSDTFVNSNSRLLRLALGNDRYRWDATT
jgi:hypothetical protein